MASLPPGDGQGADSTYATERSRMVAEIADMARETAGETGHARFSDAVMEAMRKVPRHRFVDPTQAGSAYRNHPLPIGRGQTISQPYIVALTTHLVAPQKHHRVLEIGTGSGYQAAVLSRLAREVFTIERFRTLADSARDRLKTLGYNNVEVLFGDGLVGNLSHAPYDRIIVTAAAETVPQPLIQQLAEDGMMILPLGPHEGRQDLVRVTRTRDGIEQEKLIGVRFVPLLPGRAREL